MEIVLILAGALMVWAIVIYNLLVRDRNRCLAAWSDISVQLKRRHDLVPKLVAAVQQYAGYEQATLSAVTELRTRSDQTDSIAEKGRLEAVLGSGLRKLIAVAEDYPDLKADRGFLDLQSNLTEVENQIQYARRYYNGAVRNLNTRIDTFPDLFIARLFGYRYMDYFELDSPDEAESPELS